MTKFHSFINYIIFIVFVIFCSALLFFSPVHAQLILPGYAPNTATLPSDQADISAGQKLYEDLRNKKVACANLQEDDFEKIGEYLMNRQFASTQQHIDMNDTMKRMMGGQSEARMHIALGKRGTSCKDNVAKGDVLPMMGWDSGYFILLVLIHTALLIDLIFAGIWLWQRIQSKRK